MASSATPHTAAAAAAAHNKHNSTSTTAPDNHQPTVHRGLVGVYADESAICTVGLSGMGLNYRGYAIEELAEHCEFEEVAYLLLYGRLPTRRERDEYVARLAPMRALPPALCTILEQLPATAHPMDVQRTACSAIGTMETEPEDPKARTPEGGARVAERLMSVLGSAVLYWYHFKTSGVRAVPSVDPNETMASAFVRMLKAPTNGASFTPDPLHVRTVDASMTLYAEHDLAATTFAARVTISSLSDMHSAITTAIGTLRGPLHGGANEAVMHMLKPYRSPDAAESAIREMLAKKQLVMGFGHRIYKGGDPRNKVFKGISRMLSMEREGSGGDPTLYAVSERVEKLMETEKNMFPNADFYAASSYYQCGIPIELFTPIFVVGRTSGWAAHCLEQRSANRLIRPSAVYTGPPPRTFVPINERTEENAKL